MMKNYIFIFKAAILLLGFQLFANPTFAADFALTVTGGTGSGTYASGATVNIAAGAAAPGDVFDRWVINGGTPVFGSIYSATTTLVMPSSDATVTAAYVPAGPYFDDFEALTSLNGNWLTGGTVGTTLNTLTLNTTDMVQGAGCLQVETVGSTTQFNQTFTAPVNTGATLANGVVSFKYWIEDPSKLGPLLSVELRSGTESTAEHQWNIEKANVVAGWNHFNLRFSSVVFTVGGANLGCNPAAATYFRIYSSTSVAGLKARIDALMIYDPVVAKVDPFIIWANPADVAINTALSSTQLNATSSIVGKYTYTPASGTVLAVLETKELSVTFLPHHINAFWYNTVTKKASINVVASTAIKNTNTVEFKMYPNPLSRNAVLTIKGDAQENSTLNIINLNGQVVYTHQLRTNQTLSLNGVLEPGVYMVSLISNKSTVNQKLVVE